MTSVPSPARERASVRRGAALLTLFVGAATLAATWPTWSSAHEQARRARQADLDYRVRDAERRIEHRVEAYEFVLRAVHGRFLEGDVTRDGFRRFVGALQLPTRYPGIQGVGFEQVVPRAALPAHLAAVRAEGLPGYAIHPAGDRALYTSVVMIEPFFGRNLRALGFDGYTEPVRRAAMESATALADIVASGKVTLVQETDRDVQPGFLMYRPIFSPGAEEHRPALGTAADAPGLRGWVYASFRMRDFMRGVFGERAADLDINLYDGDGESPGALLYDGTPDHAAVPRAAATTVTRRLSVAHHVWTMTIHPLPAFEARAAHDESSVVAWAGVVGAALLMLLTWSLASARTRALALAEERERSLRIAHDELQRIIREQEIIFNSANVGIVMIVDRNIVWVNRGGAELLGYSRAEMLGESTRKYYKSEEDFAAFGGAAYPQLLKGLPVELDVELRHREGRPIWTRFNGTLVDPHDLSKGTLWILSDRTAQKQADDALAALNSALAERVAQAVTELRAKDQLLIAQSRQAAMGEMIGNIAHQWRQPLNALGLVLSNLRDVSRAGELDAVTVEDAVRDGNRLVQTMSSTINDFRDFFRPEKQKHAFRALTQLRETVGLVEASYRHAGIAIVLEVESEPVLFGFSNEYSQVLLNLLANAKEAIQSTKVTEGRVTVRLGARDGLGCLVVRDNGGGVAAGHLEKIFEPYFSTKDGGTGIGLYMSRQIVERSMGGRLEVRNVEGGAEFTVLMPLADPSAPIDAPQ